MSNNCPTLQHILAASDCLEDFGGLGSVVYAFNKADLKAPLVRVDNTYTWPTETDAFTGGAGLYKFECKEDSQGIVGASQGRRAGFKQTLSFVLEAVNADSAKAARAFNNLDLGYIIKDGDTSIIVYSPDRKFTYESEGIKADTGKTPEDDRQVSLEGSLKNCYYPLYYVNEPAAGWDSLLYAPTTNNAETHGDGE